MDASIMILKIRYVDLINKLRGFVVALTLRGSKYSLSKCVFATIDNRNSVATLIKYFKTTNWRHDFCIFSMSYFCAIDFCELFKIIFLLYEFYQHTTTKLDNVSYICVKYVTTIYIIYIYYIYIIRIIIIKNENKKVRVSQKYDKNIFHVPLKSNSLYPFMQG